MSIGIMWLSFSINGILRFLNPDLIWSELNFISRLRWSAFFESLIAFKRAGCNGIITYFAPFVAKNLLNKNDKN